MKWSEASNGAQLKATIVSFQVGIRPETVLKSWESFEDEAWDGLAIALQRLVVNQRAAARSGDRDGIDAAVAEIRSALAVIVGDQPPARGPILRFPRLPSRNRGAHIGDGAGWRSGCHLVRLLHA